MISRLAALIPLITLLIYLAMCQNQPVFPSDQSKRINEWDRLFPTLVICILVRNKAHVLPHFFGHLEDLDYPKDRIGLFVRTDHNVDHSRTLVEKWLQSVGDYYQKINYEPNKLDDITKFEGEAGPFDWTVPERGRWVAKLKQMALDFARRSWADYIFYIDSDVFLTERRVLQKLITARKTVISPLLHGPINDESNFTNFHMNNSSSGSITTGFIFDRDQPDIWPVSIAHGAVLIDLTHVKSGLITFDPDLFFQSNFAVPGQRIDDVTVLTESMKSAGLQYFLDNRLVYGAIVPPMRQDLTDLKFDIENVRFAVLESLNDGPPGFLESPFIRANHPIKSKFGLGEIYMINLKRRPDKLLRMEKCFEILGMDVSLIEGTDGNLFNDSNELTKQGVKPLLSFRDPKSRRGITKGEIGCFLSHYRIWQKIVDDSLEHAAIFEDDIRFTRYFGLMLRNLVEDLKSNPNFKWDLIYLGRKILKSESNLKPSLPIPQSVRNLAPVGYSYWTIGYLLSSTGAKKLLASDPLSKLIPVDEFFPLMFDQHADLDLKNVYPTRNLMAFSVNPLFIHPVRYTGQRGYISDTDFSDVLIRQDSLDQLSVPVQSGRSVEEL